MTEIFGVSTFVRVLTHSLNALAVEHNAPTSDFPLLSVIKKLVRALEFAARVIDDAERRARDRQDVRNWLLQLREVLFQLNDLVDDLQSQVLRNLQPGCVSFSFSLWNPFTKGSRLAQALKQVSDRLDTQLKDARMFEFSSFPKLAVVSRRAASNRRARCWPEILGREHDEEVIKDAIFNHVDAADSSGVLVVAIVGIGGIGKTSLAQLIYNDPDICSRFEIMFFADDNVKTDDEPFPLLRQMIAQTREGSHRDFTSAEKMRTELCELLKENRFLVVVNDSRPESSAFKFFEEVFQIGSNGSVVLVTTRFQSVAEAFMASMVHRVDRLSDYVCHKLFSRYAFCSSILRVQPELNDLGWQMVQCCRGVPLYVQILGKYLYNNDNVQQWRDLLRNLQVHDVDGIHPVIMLVHDNLPSYLKLPHCIWHWLKVSSAEELICLWMALGFLYSDNPNQQPEYTGRMYLRELADSALCSGVQYAPGGVVTDIELHDIVNEIAAHAAHEHGFGDLRKYESYDSSRKTEKYLIVDEDRLADGAFLVNLCDKKELQLLILCRGKRSFARSHMNILSTFRSLRVLGLGGCDIENLPDSIGQLKHLRYLDFAGNKFLNCLPDSICNLWHLQTLLLHGCTQLKKLPAGIGKLQNLRYLTLTTSQDTLQEEIGQLTSLRTLGLSNCLRLVSLPYSLGKLKKLQTLGIVDCPKVDFLARSSIEALSGMDDIDTLLLSGLPEFRQLLLNLGTPAASMKHLLIQSCMKLTEPGWLNQFLSLHSLTIEDCPQLSTLTVESRSQFKNIAELVIRRCPQLGGEDWIWMFRSLKSLIIDGCPNLGDIGDGFNKLEKLKWLEIRHCPELIRTIQFLRGKDRSYLSHVEVIELDGFTLKRPLESN